MGEWAKDPSLPIESDRAGRDARIRGTICAELIEGPFDAVIAGPGGPPVLFA